MASWRGTRERLVSNLAADLGQVRDRQIKARVVGFMTRANAEYGAAVARAIGRRDRSGRTARDWAASQGLGWQSPVNHR
jgi:catalase